MSGYVYWLPCMAALLHIIEEFAWPGGFLAWHRRYRPQLAASITARHAFVLNTILLAATFVLGWRGPDASWGVSLWLELAALLAGNALFHLFGARAMRRYSPGAVTGLALYLPLCIGGFGYLLANGLVSWRVAAVSFAVGGSYQIWSTLVHRARVAA